MGEINKDVLMLGGESGSSKYKKEGAYDSMTEEIKLKDLKLLTLASETFDERLKKSKKAGNTTLTALADVRTILLIDMDFIEGIKKKSAEQDSIFEKYKTIFDKLEIERLRLLEEDINNEGEEVQKLADEVKNNLSSFVSEFGKTFDIKN